MQIEPGTRLGPYEILSQLGQGGMGVVYRATDTRLDREVAIKAMSARFTDDPIKLTRFEREAKLLASLNHPKIAAIYAEQNRIIQVWIVEAIVENFSGVDVIFLTSDDTDATEFESLSTLFFGSFSLVALVASHGVDVGERVGDGDGAEGLWVVDDGRDEVHGEHQRGTVLRAHHGRILQGAHVGVHPGVGERLNLLQDLHQVLGTQLAGSTAGRNECR